MSKFILGVKTIKHGAPAADGGMGTSLSSELSPYNESVEFDDESGELVQHFLQGARYPFLSIYQAKGTKLVFSVPMTNEDLVEWMGGTITTGVYSAPRGNFQVTKSLELMTEFDVPIKIPAATCYGERKFGKKITDVSLIQVTAIVELPSKADAAPMMIGNTTVGG